MKALMRWLWLVVMVLGVITLVFGVILTAAGATMPGKVVDAIADENIPVFTYNETNVVDNYLDFNMDNPIDTAAEISDTSDAINDALNKMHPPELNLVAVSYNVTQQGPVTQVAPGVYVVKYYQVVTMDPANPAMADYATGIRALKKDQDYVNTMAMKTGLDLAGFTIKTAPLYLFIGIGLLLGGLALIFIGLVLFGMGKGMTQMGDGLGAIMGKLGPPPAAK